MTSVRKVEKELKTAGRPGLRAEDAPPAGISPVLRASWKFAREMAGRFGKETLSDRAAEFLKNLTRRFA